MNGIGSGDQKMQQKLVENVVLWLTKEYESKVGIKSEDPLRNAPPN